MYFSYTDLQAPTELENGLSCVPLLSNGGRLIARSLAQGRHGHQPAVPPLVELHVVPGEDRVLVHDEVRLQSIPTSNDT